MKRKSSARNQTANTIVSSLNENEAIELSIDEIDRKYDLVIEQVTAGDYGELRVRTSALRIAKERRIAIAERHKRLQIRNINQLFDYELEDATAIFNREFEETQESMISEVNAERAKFKALKKYLEAQSEANASAEDQIGAAGNGATTGSRSLRSNAVVAAESVELSERYDTRRGSRLDKSNAKKKSGGQGANGLLHGIEQTLPESAMRTDFLEIVRDMQNRAAHLANSRPSEAGVIAVTVGADLSELCVGEETFSIGDYVSVFSVLSQESICGTITAISKQEVVLRMGSGARFSFLLSQLRCKRVTISGDIEHAS